MVLVNHFKYKIWALAFLVILLTSMNLSAQENSNKTSKVNVDSLLSKYHLMGVKIFINKVGVFSLKEKMVSLSRSDFNDRVLFNIYSSVSFSENNYGASFDYVINNGWILRGESIRRIWGQQSGIGVLYRLEY